MNSLKIAMIQTPILWEDIAGNLASYQSKILHLDEDTDVILLPEMFSTGFSMANKSLAEEPDGATFRWMLGLSKATKKSIVGSYIVVEDGSYFNRLIWMNPSGDFHTYDKRFLFRMADEDKFYKAGTERTIIDFKGWKILPLICYDLRFPTWSRNRYDHKKEVLDYDVLIYIANWPEKRILAWDTLLRARAIENNAYCVGVNRIGSDDNRKVYNGHTSIYDAVGERLAFSEEEEVLYYKLDKEPLDKYRSKFPSYLDQD